MCQLQSNFQQTLEAQGTPRALYVAFSGGLDSTVLLHLAAHWAQQHAQVPLTAVHVHHGLQKQADDWLVHCQQVCKRLGIPLISAHLALEKQARRSLEEQARTARYQVFAQYLPTDGYLLTGHHQHDQAESVILALKRGSGVRGLAAIHPFARFAKGFCLRPLLNTSRQQLLTYAQAQKLDWIDDPSNTNLQFDRNFVRHQILPMLQQRWPHWVAAASESAAYCWQQNIVLTELLQEQLAHLLEKNGSLPIATLARYQKARRDLLLRQWIIDHTGIIPPKTRLQLLWPEVAMARQDANPCLCLGAWAVRRFSGRLFLCPHPLANYRQLILPITIGSTCALPDDLGTLQLITSEHSPQIRHPRLGEAVSIRFHCHHKIQPNPYKASRPLKKIWQDYQVPPWKRGRIPLLFYGETCVAALGYFVCAQAIPINGQAGLICKINEKTR